LDDDDDELAELIWSVARTRSTLIAAAAAAAAAAVAAAAEEYDQDQKARKNHACHPPHGTADYSDDSELKYTYSIYFRFCG